MGGLTNPGTIRIVLVLMLMAGMTGEIVDIKGALLQVNIEKAKKYTCVYLNDGKIGLTRQRK